MNNTTQKNEQQELSDEQIAQAVRPLYASDIAAEMGLPDDIRTVRLAFTALSRPSAIRAQAIEDCAQHIEAIRSEGFAAANWKTVVATSIRSLASQPVQDGYVLVPVEPTDAMLQAAWDSCSFGDETTYRECWQAMIAAAPQPSTEAAEQGDDAFDREAEATVRDAGLDGGRINPDATSVTELFIYDEPEASSDKAVVTDERDLFEAQFPMPSQCMRCGDGYAPTGYNAWEANNHCERWKGWKARALLQSAAPAPHDAEIEQMLDADEESDMLTIAYLDGFHKGKQSAAPAQTEAKPEAERERFSQWRKQPHILDQTWKSNESDLWLAWQAAIASLSVSAQEGEK